MQQDRQKQFTAKTIATLLVLIGPMLISGSMGALIMGGPEVFLDIYNLINKVPLGNLLFVLIPIVLLAILSLHIGKVRHKTRFIGLIGMAFAIMSALVLVVGNVAWGIILSRMGVDVVLYPYTIFSVVNLLLKLVGPLVILILGLVAYRRGNGNRKINQIIEAEGKPPIPKKEARIVLLSGLVIGIIVSVLSVFSLSILAEKQFSSTSPQFQQLLHSFTSE